MSIELQPQLLVDGHVDFLSRTITNSPFDKPVNEDIWKNPKFPDVLRLECKLNIAGSTINGFSKDPCQENWLKDSISGLSLLSQMEKEGLIKIQNNFPKNWETDKGEQKLMVFPYSEGIYTPDSETVLKWLYERKIVGLSFTWVFPNDWSASQRCIDGEDFGLKQIAIDLIRELNSWRGYKPFIDISHSSYKSMLTILKLYHGPVVASHANAFDIYPRQVQETGMQNIKDDVLKMMTERTDSDGLVSIFPWRAAVQNEQQSPTDWDELIRHFDHLLQIVGPKKIGWSSDPGNSNSEYLFPDIFTPSLLTKLIEELETRGYGTEIVQGVAGKNWTNFLTGLEKN